MTNAAPRNVKARKQARRQPPRPQVPTTPQGLLGQITRPLSHSYQGPPMPTNMGAALQEIANLRAGLVITADQQKEHDAILGSLRTALDETREVVRAKEEEIANTRDFAQRWEGACRMAMQTMGAIIWDFGAPGGQTNASFRMVALEPSTVAMAQGARFKLSEATRAGGGQLITAELLDALEPEGDDTPISVSLVKGERPAFTDEAKADFRRRFIADNRLGDLQVTEEQLDALLEAALSGDVAEVHGVEQAIASSAVSSGKPGVAQDVPDTIQGSEEPRSNGDDGRDGGADPGSGDLPARDVPGGLRPRRVPRRAAGQG